MKFERDENSRFSPLVDTKGRHYGEKEGGYIEFGSVSSHFLGRQTQYGSRFIEGRIQGYPRLGKGLRFNGGEGGNYHSIGIHPDDIEEFIARYNAYTTFINGYVEDGHGNERELIEEEVASLHNFLQSIGAFPEEQTEQ